MHPLLLLLALARPYWEAKAPKDWTEEELQEMLGSSPWARAASFAASVGQAPAVTVYLATARPVREAEEELTRRMPERFHPDEEYREFLKLNEGQALVLAIVLPKRTRVDEAEIRRMEEQTFLKVGKKRFPVEGHFPPGPGDPALRLAFPRAVGPGDKEFSFELYLPGVVTPFRQVQFFVKDLEYKGKPEF